METVQTKGLTAMQKQMMLHMFLVLFVGAGVAYLLHRRELIISFLMIGWMLSILIHTRVAVGYGRIVFSVLSMGVLMYVLQRFIMPWVFG